MSDRVATYAERIPTEVRLALDGLTGRTDTGYAVVMLLLEADDPLRFGEVRERLGVHQQTLTDTLESLQVGGVVQKRAGEEGTGGYSLSTFGRRILDGLYTASLDPAESPMKRSVPQTTGRTTFDVEANTGGGEVPTDPPVGNLPPNEKSGESDQNVSKSFDLPAPSNNDELNSSETTPPDLDPAMSGV